MNDKTWYDEVKEDFIKNINDSYTLNLAVSVLEDRKELLSDNLKLKEQLQQKEDNINKAQEEFISEFYSCDNEEALKRLYSKLCCLKEENQQLKEQLEASEKARKEAIEHIKELYDNTDDTTCYDIDKVEKERLLQILDIDKGE